MAKGPTAPALLILLLVGCEDDGAPAFFSDAGRWAPTDEEASGGDGDEDGDRDSEQDESPGLDAGRDADLTGSDAMDADTGGDEHLATGDCPTRLLGFATLTGDGVTGTTGGGDAKPVRPTTPEQLMELARDDSPRVIEIAGRFSVPLLAIGSNKTLVGVDATATIQGGVRIRGNKDEPVSNVILKNLRVDGASTQADGDAVQIYFAHHVWVDHLEIWDGPDGNLDMTHAVNWVTVSWTKFRYSEAYQRPQGESSDHRYSSLIGHSDGNAKEDAERLKITFHHNWWAERVIERMPRVRFGQVHVFNNLFAAPGNNYCVRAGAHAQLLVEGNVFDGVNNPHEFNSDSDRKTAHITAHSNLYDNATGTQATGGEGVAFTKAPYDGKLEDAALVKARVKACAGPR